MKKSFGVLFVMFLAFRGFGAGLVILHEPDFWRLPPRQPYVPPAGIVPLESQSVHADVRIKDQVAETSIDQEF